jgi:micrococcal nuclease
MVVKPATLIVATLAVGAVGFFLGRGCQPNLAPLRTAQMSSPVSAPEANYDPGDYYLDHIVDGDTVWVRKGSDLTNVRLLRVDAPERDENGYAEATQELQRLLGDESSIRLEFEEEPKDEHGRTLAYLFVEGRNVNVDLVRSGWSAFFDRYGRGKYAKEFVAAEAEARRERRGIWSNR